MGQSFKVGDMNVSKVLKNGIAASTKTGSPLYSAPEVWDSEKYDAKCDLWSLGALVY
jgi:serine/threonine-protein kinase ULK/ATG1